MKRLIGVILCFSVLFVACNKKNQLTETNTQKDFPKTMYVNATEGLRVRNSPSSDGEKVGLLKHNTQVIITKEDINTVNIGGVEGKWVYITTPVEGWVFDGFLVDFEKIKEEFIDNQQEKIEVSAGNISVSVPNYYGVSSGIEYNFVILHEPDTTRLNYHKGFNINIFKKDSYFEKGPGEYDASILPSLTSYLNGTSQEKPQINIFSSMRRNKIKGINVCETLTLSKFVIDDTQFEHQIIFIDNEYCYIMDTSFGGSGFDREIRRELSGYFRGDDWIHKKLEEIGDQFANFQKMPDYIEKLYAESMRIFNTMVINK